jgi:hypothetical protein
VLALTLHPVRSARPAPDSNREAASTCCDWLCRLFLPAFKHASVAHSAAVAPVRVTCVLNCDRHSATRTSIRLVRRRYIHFLSLTAYLTTRRCRKLSNRLLSASHYRCSLHAHAHPRSLRLGPPAVNPWHLLRALAVHASTKQDDIRGFLFEHH